MLAVLARVAGAGLVGLRALDQTGAKLQLLASYGPDPSSSLAMPLFDLPLSYVDCPMSRSLIDRIVLDIGDSTELVLFKVLNEEPAAPTALVPEVPRALEVIATRR